MSIEDLRRFSLAFNKDPKNTLALNAVTENGIATVALSRKEVDRQNFTFSHLIDSPDAPDRYRDVDSALLKLAGDEVPQTERELRTGA